MKTILLSQKAERDNLLANTYLSRNIVLSTADLLQSKTIKLITGPRRVGKSVFALLLLKQQNFAYLNFDDNQLLTNWNEDLVMLALQQVYPNYKYLLLDEVQNLPNWDLWVSKLYRQGVNMVITGSNANMLSQEMSTVLTGRYIPIEMLPFSLTETLQWKQLDSNSKECKNQKTLQVQNYLFYGGYPEIVNNLAIAKSYLSTLYDSILLKDVAKRHKIRNTDDLYNLAAYLLANFCNSITANDLCSNLGFKSVTTVQKFLQYLHEPYLFFYLPRYNNKLQYMKKAAHKVYVVDNGFVNSAAFNLSENRGRLLENQVFVELLRRGYNIETTLFYYHSRNDKEVDFVTRQGAKVEQLIQVCYDLSAGRTRKRELDSLVECAEELNCDHLSIVTYSDEQTITYRSHTINIVPVSKW